MTSTNQKLIQAYLERHGVGILFEEMMAKLIKNMPNEPVPYLLKLLQKVQQLKSTTSENTFPPSTVYRSGMGLVGSSIPKKLSKDPAVILPGSKPLVSTWSAGKDAESSVIIEDEKLAKSKSYDKPWLAGAKPAKPKQKGLKGDVSSWKGTDTKVSSRSFDDIFDDTKKDKRKRLSKSLESPLSPRQKSYPDHNWNIETRPQPSDKENIQPLLYTRNTGMAAEETDELEIPPTNIQRGKKITISPATYSRFKKQNSRRKSDKQKQKLQELLSQNGKDNRVRRVDSKDESTEGEDEIEVLESQVDLADEGVNTKTSSGFKRPCNRFNSTATETVKISVCSRCATLLIPVSPNSVTTFTRADSESLFKPRPGSLDDSEEDDFESISQINNNRPYRPKWPVLTDSEGDEVEEITANLSLDTSKPSPTKFVNFKSSGLETDKSDFFKENSPLRKKTKQQSIEVMSDNKTGHLPARSLTKKQAWEQATTTASELDTAADDVLVSSPLKCKGWTQQDVYTDDASDLL